MPLIQFNPCLLFMCLCLLGMYAHNFQTAGFEVKGAKRTVSQFSHFFDPKKELRAAKSSYEERGHSPFLLLFTVF